MFMNDTKHISEVCKKLHTTSRTIRYYEQLGLIRTSRETPTAPRRLDSENTEKLRKILFLRQIGLTLDEISEIVRSGTDAAEVLRSKEKEIFAEIAALKQRIRLLERVTKAAETGGDIYALEMEQSVSAEDQVRMKIAAHCLQCMREQRFSDILPFIAERLKPVCTAELLAETWRMFIEKSGAVRETCRQIVEGNMVVTLVSFEKIGGKFTTSFEGEYVTGFALEYWNEKEYPYVSSDCTGQD